MIEKKRIRDNDIQSFLLYGKEQESLAASILLNSNRDGHFSVYRRECISEVMKKLQENRNVLIFSNYGNGKTCLLWQIATELFQRSEEVYFLSDSSIDYFEELKQLSQSSNKTKYVIVDDCMAKEGLFKNYEFLRPSNILFICADRTEIVKKWGNKVLPEENFDISTIPVDDFSISDTESFIKIIDFIGQWGRLAGGGIETKRKFLADESNHIRLSDSLMKLLQSPVIKDKISALCKTFLDDKKYQDLVISICYLRMIGIRPDFNLVYEISDSDYIYAPTLSNNEQFCQLFTLRNDYVEVSDIFANYFMASDLVNSERIIERLYFIIEKFNKYSNRDYKQNAIFRSALRFHIVSRLLPDNNRRGMLFDYYEQLKTILPWLKSDPNYWMQYAMAKMMQTKFLDEAQKLLETAYSVAEKKNEYDVSKINNQQARLYLLFAQTRTVESDKFSYFQKSDSILKHVEMDSYAMHRIGDMLDFYDKSFTNLSIRTQKGCAWQSSFLSKKDRKL